MKMKLLLAIVVGCYCVILSHAEEFFYPPLFWQRDNCPFSEFKDMKATNVTKELFMKVLPYTGMKVLCPRGEALNTWPKHGFDAYFGQKENLWHVDKDGYDKCVANKNAKLMLVCDKPKSDKFLKLSFHPTLSFEEPRFVPGRHYYFISTSRGFGDDVGRRRSGGAFGSCERYHMKLHIYVCNPKIEDCIWEKPRCSPSKDFRQRMLMIDGKLPGPPQPTVAATKATVARQKTSAQQPSSLAQEEIKKCSDENGTSLYLILNFVLGGVILFLIVVVIILACALSGKSKVLKLNPPTRSHSSETIKQRGIYESVPVQLPPPNMAPIGNPHGDYLIYARTPEALQHAVLRTPRGNNYETPVFTFPDVPGRSRTNSTQAKSTIQTNADNKDSARV